MRHYFFAILTIVFWLSSAHADVKAEVIGRILKVSVQPYAPLKPYSLWYQQRRDSDGNRFGRREFWLQHPLTHNYYSFKNVCDAFVQAAELHLTINLDTITDKAMWAQFNCLRLDADAFTIAYPTIEKFLKPELPALKAVYAEYNKDAYPDYAAAGYQLKADASNALYMLINFAFSADRSDWYKNAEYREALLNKTLKEFNKKSYAGHDPVITKPFVIVTHASTIFDDKSIKTFADANVQQAKMRGLPVVYLVSDDGVHDQTWYLADRSPDRSYYSKNGEHSVLYSSNTVILMGGFYTQCLRTTQLDTITRHFLLSNEALTIHLPIQGIYAHESIDFAKMSHKYFLERVKEGSILGGYEVLDDHGGWVDNDMSKLTGVPNLKEYTVNIYTDDKLIYTEGSGARVVHLKFWSANQFWSQINN
jgi:hypothetical protein